MDDEVLAIRLLVAGVSVSEDGKLGTDDDGQKNVRDQARFIGRNLGQQRELGFLVGVWASTCSCLFRCLRSTAIC